jgi:tetratricopeptide (TPR) repeat protein
MAASKISHNKWALSIAVISLNKNQDKPSTFSVIAESSLPPDTITLAPLPEEKELLEEFRKREKEGEEKIFYVGDFPLLFLYQSPLAYLNMAVSFFEEGQFLKAKELLSRSQEVCKDVSPDFKNIVLGTINFYYGRIFLQEGHYSAAVERFKEAIDILPDEPRLYVFLGITYLTADIFARDYDKAKDAFNKALQLLPPDSAEAREVEEYMQRLNRVNQN